MSESEALAPSRPDGALLRVWEIPGSHVNYCEASMAQVQVARASGFTGAEYDEAEAGQYGERGPVLVTGTLPVSVLFGNTFPTRYSFRAALHHLNTWVRDGQPAPAAPRFVANGFGRATHGNVAGGVPQPAAEVPVANYVNVTFGGFTLPFDSLRLLVLYPTHDAYVSKMQAATDRAVAAGYMLPEDAEEMDGARRCVADRRTARASRAGVAARRLARRSQPVAGQSPRSLSFPFGRSCCLLLRACRR